MPTLRFRSAAAERALLLNPELEFGEQYMKGAIEVEDGSIADVLEVISANFSRRPTLLTAGLSRFRQLTRRLRQNNDRRRAPRRVAHHYDLNEQFYRLFLDKDLQYSCAYFESEGQSIDDAQLAKKRHLAAKLVTSPGQSVLDVGCGWGGLPIYLAEMLNLTVTGVTLSAEQARVAAERAAASPAADRLQIEQRDYRTLERQFDRIISVGMFEHVGIGRYNEFFRTCHRLLADDGVMVLHAIGRTDGPGSTNPFIDKYIFPGGYIPALSEVFPAIERSGLVTTDMEILRMHYAETLRHWRLRFLDRHAEALQLYDERFLRMWEFYLAGAEMAFRTGTMMVFQIQLAKRQTAVPITRAYLAEAERKLRETEGHHRMQ